MQRLFFLVYLAAVFAAAKPSNDWSKPCFNGECAYDLPEGGHNGFGSVKIFGSPASITDITPAAGWVILDCDKNRHEQEIRLVCSGHDEESRCNHLFDHGGPVDKLVRLPEACGAGPFARIAGSRVSKDQTLPAHAQSRVSRRANGETSQVHVLTVDVNFAAVDATKVEPVSFAAVGANFPVSFDSAETTSLHARDTDGLFDSLIGVVSQATKAVNNFDVHPNISKAFDFQRHIDLLNLRQTCGAIGLGVDVGVDAKAHADVSVGIVAVGTLIPPKFDRFGAHAGLSADVDAKLHVNTTLRGTIDTGRQKIQQLTVPAISIPGIFSAGPSLVVEYQLTAQLDLSLALDVAAKFQLQKVQLWLPPTAGQSSVGGVVPVGSSVKILANPNADASGDIQGHIIPSVRLDISGLGGQIKAGASLEIDTYGKLHLDSRASPSGILRRSAGTLAARAADTRDASFTGCADVKFGVSIKGGAEGNVFGLLDLSKKITLLNNDFQILKKCWNAGLVTREVSQRRRRSSLEHQYRDVAVGPVCPTDPVAAAQLAPVVDETQ